jgi:branched-chain amino acid transport system ATP-binding protein
MNLLACEKVHKNFGGLVAVNQVELKVDQGEIVGLIGPNGAGKTTLFNLITGFLVPTSGKIVYQGKDITWLPPHVLGGRGLVRTFQKINIFPELTVLDNILIGRYLHIKGGFIQSLLQSRVQKQEEKMAQERAMQVLNAVGLSGWEGQQAKNLPFGLQRALGISIALAAQPKLLLLDEPASGMNTEEKKHITEVIRKIYQSGITILIVEHDMNVVMNLCQRIIVLDYGTVLTEGTPEEVQHDPRVIEVYLGKGYRKNVIGAN